MQFDTALDDDDLERMIAAIDPEWRVREATAAEAGHHAVYRLALETPAGERECYLKATPEEKPPTVDTETRLLAILDAHTTIPVPTVYGAVDEHDELPAPYAVVEAMPGEAHLRTALPEFPRDTHRAVARETGRHLAELHAVDAVDAFGFLTHDGPTRRGGRPDGDRDAIGVADPIEDWHERLHDWADGTLERVGETRFGEVAPEAEPVLRDRIDDVRGPFDPVLARVDQSIENVLLDGDEVTAAFDWEFTIAATPAYDLQCCAWSLAGGPYLHALGVDDRRPLVREALCAGYREHGAGRVVDQYRANRACYDLLSVLRSMVHLQDWFELFDLDEDVDDAAAALRTEVIERLE